MKVLITGANGYIGKNLIKKLIQKKVNFIATDIDNSNLPTNIEFKKANIFNDKNLYEYFEKPDVCVHLAWRDGFVHNSEKHISDLPLHFKFLKEMIDGGTKRIVVLGSMHEIGYFVGKINAYTYCNPLSYYGISKNSLRQMLEVYSKSKKFNLQWVRCFYIYGDNKGGNSIFSKLLLANEEGKLTFPFTSGSNKYDFISIDQLAEQLFFIINNNFKFGIINCCSGEPMSLSSAVNKFIKDNNLNIKLDYNKFPDRIYDSPLTYGDNTAITIIRNSFLYKEKRILITGSKGQLGIDLLRELSNRGFNNVIGIDKEDIDISNKDLIMKFVLKTKPDIIVHCAAWTQVDTAEDNKADVFETNALGTQYISEAANILGAKLIYISTDYVFNGEKQGVYDENDEVCPINIYGVSKAKGEKFALDINDKTFVLRISWAFGPSGRNFAKTIVDLIQKGKTIKVVDDQFGSPTYTPDLSKAICDIMVTEKYGIYNVTNEGYTSWYEYAMFIAKKMQADSNIIPVHTKEYISDKKQAKRPLNSRLSKEKLKNNGFSLLPRWEDALERFLNIYLDKRGKQYD